MTAAMANKIERNLSIENIDVIPYLNNGGCGVFACFFAEKMIRLGYQANILKLAEPEDFDFYKTRLSEDNSAIHDAFVNHSKPGSNIAVGEHICVEIDGFYFDSTMCSRKDCNNEIELLNGMQYEILYKYPLSEIKYISIESRGKAWNPMYDPRHNSQIEKIINSALSFLSPSID